MARLSFNMARPRVLRALRGSAVRLHAAPPMPGPACGAGMPLALHGSPFRLRAGPPPAAWPPRYAARRSNPARHHPAAMRPPSSRSPPRARGAGESPAASRDGKEPAAPQGMCREPGKIPRKKNRKKSEKFLKKNKKSVDTK